MLVVTEAVPDSPGPAVVDAIDLMRLEFRLAVGLKNLPAMRRVEAELRAAMAAFGPDLIHLNDTGFGSLFFLRGGATGTTPRVLTIHSPVRPRSRPGLQSRLAGDVDRMILVSHAQYGVFRTELPEAIGKASVIQNALPTPPLAPSELPFAPPRLLCLGRLVHDKGFDVAIRAFAILHGRGSRATMVVAGGGGQQPGLERLAHNLGLGDSIHFTGMVPPEDVHALINTATAMVVPSRWPEPFGLVALQAAQMGRPVIAAASGGLTDVVADGETGWLVPPEDADATADRMALLLANPDMARRLGANARRRATEAFGFDAFLDAYESAFASTIDRARQRAAG